jgi:TPR repeat protein
MEVAAAKNTDQALINLSYLYEQGRGLPRDEVKALACLRKAAESGRAEAQFRMGECFYFGENATEKNFPKAAIWLRKASTQGHAGASNRFAVML